MTTRGAVHRRRGTRGSHAREPINTPRDGSSVSLSEGLTFVNRQLENLNRRARRLDLLVGVLEEDVFKLTLYTTTEMNAIDSPQAGWLIFNSDESEPFYYSGSDWLSVIDGASE